MWVLCSDSRPPPRILAEKPRGPKERFVAAIGESPEADRATIARGFP
jgi:hypothetical protein